MNENKNEDGTLNSDVEEVQAPSADATQEEKDEYVRKLESSKNQLYVRLKKAEGFEFKDGKWVKPSKPAETTTTTDTTTTTSKEKLTTSDMFAVLKANVPEEDIDDIVEYATLKKISVTEALKSNIVQTILKTKAEERKTAEGTNTQGGKRGSAKLSDEALLSNARKGIYPESDEDMERLTRIQRASR